MQRQVNQQTVEELRQSLVEYESRADHAGRLVLAQILEALEVKRQTGINVLKRVIEYLSCAAVTDEQSQQDALNIANVAIETLFAERQ